MEKNRNGSVVGGTGESINFKSLDKSSWHEKEHKSVLNRGIQKKITEK